MKRIRIKKDFDLQQLETFGFKSTNHNNIYFCKTTNSNSDEYETGLLINPTNAEYENQIVYYINDKYDTIDLTCELELLYNLIKLGIVEEFEED